MDTSKLTMRRGATAVLNAMQNGDHRQFAMTEALSGEKPHAAMIAATSENPALLRAIVRLVRKMQRAAARPVPGKEP